MQAFAVWGRKNFLIKTPRNIANHWSCEDRGGPYECISVNIEFVGEIAGKLGERVCSLPKQSANRHTLLTPVR